MEVLLVLIGFVGGILGTLICLKARSGGTLRVDQSDPNEAPYLFLDLDKPVEKFMNEKYILFRISKKNFISDSE